MKNYSFTKTAIVRTPIEEKQTDLTWEKITAIFSKKENREALFIGSPNIYKALLLWEKGEAFQTEEELKSLKGSLYKYASRLSNRSTPFGMFSTVAAVDLSAETNLNIAASAFGRFTKFDMYFLGSFLPVIVNNDAIRAVLKFYSNNSIYTVFDKYRYVEYYFKDNVRIIKERHRIIRRTIRQSESPLLGKFGTMHSTLARELQREGIQIERSIQPQVFGFSGIVHRKLLAGKRPTNLEYKKGMLQELLTPSIKTDAQRRFSILYSTEMLKSLSEQQVDAFLKLPYTEILPKIFYANNLPLNPSQSTLRRFVQKHSMMHKWLRDAREVHKTFGQ